MIYTQISKVMDKTSARLYLAKQTRIVQEPSVEITIADIKFVESTIKMFYTLGELEGTCFPLKEYDKLGLLMLTSDGKIYATKVGLDLVKELRKD